MGNVLARYLARRPQNRGPQVQMSGQSGSDSTPMLLAGRDLILGSRPSKGSETTSSGDGVCFADPELPCHGCAHSAAGAPFPGHPSGERPCAFCVRNPEGIHPEILRPKPEYEGDSEYAKKARQAPPGAGIWYAGTPAFRTPMDCYIATDRLQQQRIFDELTRLELTGKEAPPREKFSAFHDPRQEVWCCDGGPAPGGHTWTCWGWLGISFG